VSTVFNLLFLRRRTVRRLFFSFPPHTMEVRMKPVGSPGRATIPFSPLPCGQKKNRERRTFTFFSVRAKPGRATGTPSYPKFRHPFSSFPPPSALRGAGQQRRGNFFWVSGAVPIFLFPSQRSEEFFPSPPFLHAGEREPGRFSFPFAAK